MLWDFTWKLEGSTFFLWFTAWQSHNTEMLKAKAVSKVTLRKGEWKTLHYILRVHVALCALGVIVLFTMFMGLLLLPGQKMQRADMVWRTAAVNAFCAEMSSFLSLSIMPNACFGKKQTKKQCKGCTTILSWVTGLGFRRKEVSVAKPPDGEVSCLGLSDHQLSFDISFFM